MAAFVLGVPLVFGLWGGCTKKPVPKDELVVLIEQPPRNIDPRHLTTSYDFKLSYLSYARLVSVEDDRLEAAMDLAEGVTEVSPLTYEIKLRKAHFWDGSQVTAKDVAYTFEKLLHPKDGHPVIRRRFEDAGLVMPLSIVADDRLRLQIGHPHASFLTDLSVGLMKAGSIEADPKGRPIGAGPYIPERDNKGDLWRFTKNPYYYGGPPPTDKLTIRVVRDVNARLLSLLGGSADLTQNTVSPLLYDALARWEDRLKIQSGPSAIVTYLGINTSDKALADPRVRKALAYGINRERIIRTKLRGKAVQASSLLPMMHWAHAKGVETYPYDPQKADRLLDQAGFPKPPSGSRLKLTYKTSTDALTLSIARVVAAQLAEIGVEVEVRPYEFHVFLADVKKGNFQLFTLSTEVTEPNLMKRYFHSGYIPTIENPDAGHNRMRYRNQEMDALLDAGEKEMDRDKRAAIYDRVQRLLAADLPILPLWHADNVAVLRKGVSGYRIWPSAQLTSLALVKKE